MTCLKLFFIFILFLSLVSSQSFAQKTYSIGDLLKIAEENSAVKAAEFNALAKKNLANQELYWQNPRTRIANNGLEKDYSFSQAIPFYGKLQSKYEAQSAFAKAAEMQKNNLVLQIKAELFGLLYEFQTLQKKIALASMRIKRLTLVENYLSSIVLSSPTQQAQAKITKDHIKLVSQEMLMMQNQVFAVWQRANLYLGLEEQPKIDIIWLSGRNIPSQQSLISKAIEQNFTIQEQKYLLASMRHELSFAKVEQMPNFEVELNRQDKGGAAGSRDGIALSLSVPLFNRNQEKILGTKTQVKSLEFELEFQKKMLFNRILTNIRSFETAVKIAEIFHFNDKQIDSSFEEKSAPKSKTSLNFGEDSALPAQEQTDSAIKIAKFDRKSHLDDYIAARVKNLSRANDNFKKGILEFITYIELDSKEYEMIHSALENQVALALAYGDLMVGIGEFLLPN